MSIDLKEDNKPLSSRLKMNCNKGNKATHVAAYVLSSDDSDDDDLILLSPRLIQTSNLGTSCRNGDDSVKKAPTTLSVKRPIDDSISLNISGKKSKESTYDDDDDDIPFSQRMKKLGISADKLSSMKKKFEERELALVQKSLEECQMKRLVEEQRLRSLERDIEELSKELENKKKQVGSVQGQSSLYSQDDTIQTSIEERNKELEAKGEQLKSLQKLISECGKQLGLKQENFNRACEMVQEVTGELDEVHQKMQRKIEECDKDLGSKKAQLSLIEDLVIEREQELKKKEIEYYQVLDNIDKDCERKEEKLKTLLKMIAKIY